MALTKNRPLVWQKHCYKETALRNDYDLFRPEPGQSWGMAIFIRLQVVLPWLTLNGKGKVITMPTCRSALTSPAVKKGHSHVSPYPTPKTGHSHTHFVPPWPTLKKGHNHNDKLSFFFRLDQRWGKGTLIYAFVFSWPHLKEKEEEEEKEDRHRHKDTLFFAIISTEERA